MAGFVLTGRFIIYIVFMLHYYALSYGNLLYVNLLFRPLEAYPRGVL